MYVLAEPRNIMVAGEYNSVSIIAETRSLLSSSIGKTKAPPRLRRAA
jgi:hypothetical protein